MNPELRGQKAREILESDTFQVALKSAAETLKAEWSVATATNQREALWFELKALDRLPRELRVLRDRGYSDQVAREKHK